nr:hypothetical protein Iba_chr01eCG0550 [Ipomoea batatas]
MPNTLTSFLYSSLNEEREDSSVCSTSSDAMNTLQCPVPNPDKLLPIVSPEQLLGICCSVKIGFPNNINAGIFSSLFFFKFGLLFPIVTRQVTFSSFSELAITLPGESGHLIGSSASTEDTVPMNQLIRDGSSVSDGILTLIPGHHLILIASLTVEARTTNSGVHARG